MGFRDAVKLCFARYATFSGRADRPEFWWWVVFVNFADIVVGGLMRQIGIGAIAGLITLGLALPTFAVTARRLHDVGRSGWWQAGFHQLKIGFILPSSIAAPHISSALFTAMLLVFAATIVPLIIWVTRRSEPGPNAYGPPPMPLTAPPST